MSTSGMATIRQQVMWNRLISVVEEQAQTLIRTSSVPPPGKPAMSRQASSTRRGVCWLRR